VLDRQLERTRRSWFGINAFPRDVRKQVDQDCPKRKLGLNTRSKIRNPQASEDIAAMTMIRKIRLDLTIVYNVVYSKQRIIL